MPYYIGEGVPEWDEYLDRTKTPGSSEPIALFEYIEPLQKAVVQFSEEPGPEPIAPPKRSQNITQHQSSAPRRGFFAGLFGKRAAPVKVEPRPSPEEFIAAHNEEQKAYSARTLWNVSRTTTTCRATGVKRVLGSYDGGGDESFTHLRGAEMNDGRVIGPDELRKTTKAVDYDRLVEDAVAAMMGNYGAGEFFLRGAVIIDFDTCTITDEKNADVVFGDEVVRGT